MTTKGLSKTIHASDHYENFPVASFIIPKKIRKHVINVYNFARLADDIADEGEMDACERMRLLDLFDSVLNSKNEISTKGFKKSKIEKKIISTTNLARVDFAELKISHNWLSKLLIAFRYDSKFTVFETWKNIFEYCENSANPIGRILLELFDIRNHSKNELSGLSAIYTKSDAICTGLQIINFTQDAAEDDQRGRPTFPKEIWPLHIKNFESYKFSKLSSFDKKILIRKMVLKGREKLLQGKDLPQLLMKTNSAYSFRFSLEVALIIKCGFKMCEKILNDPNIVWTSSPKLKLLEFPKLFMSALISVILKR
jgi:phytoene/squalene synthetase